MENANLMLVNLTQLTLDERIPWGLVTPYNLISEVAGGKITIA